MVIPRDQPSANPPEAGEQHSRHPNFTALLRVAVAMLAGMTLYESLKESLLPGLTKWESHLITIGVSTLVASVAAYFVQRLVTRRNRRLQNEIEMRESTERKLLETVRELQAAAEQIKHLEGLLPICSYCKKIRDGQGDWHNIEHYISARSEAVFSHGICPDCLGQHFPSIAGSADADQ